MLKMSLVSAWGNALVGGDALDSTITQVFEGCCRTIPTKTRELVSHFKVAVMLHRSNVTLGVMDKQLQAKGENQRDSLVAYLLQWKSKHS